MPVNSNFAYSKVATNVKSNNEARLSEVIIKHLRKGKAEEPPAPIRHSWSMRITLDDALSLWDREAQDRRFYKIKEIRIGH